MVKHYINLWLMPSQKVLTLKLSSFRIPKLHFKLLKKKPTVSREINHFSLDKARRI
jgi:hypothetical protein